MKSIDELNNARKLEHWVLDRPKFSRRHDFQGKKIDLSVQNLKVMQ